MDPKAFSPDGYIISQNSTADVPYGRLRSSVNGCGWIAAYNFIKAMGGAPDASTLPLLLSENSVFGAFLGTGPRRLRDWLRHTGGYPLADAFGRKKVLALAAGCRVGILLYRPKRYPLSLHYATFTRLPEGNFRFFNAADGNPDHRMAFDDFLKLYACGLPLYLMAAR